MTQKDGQDPQRDAGQGGARNVAVYGATGHTGRFVVGELLRRGFHPIAVARDQAALSAADFQGGDVTRRVAAVDDAPSLDRAFEGALAVVNCAGAFLDTADAVAGAAVRAGIHYLDVTAEQPSAAATLEDFDAPAFEAGVVVIPAMGFYGGFADLLATIATDGWDSVDSIDVMIGLDSWQPTRGTRLTGARNTARRMVIEGGALVPVDLPARERGWQFAAPIGPQPMLEVPFSEVVLIARHLAPTTLHTYLSANALGDIRNEATPAPTLDETGRSPQRFAVEVVATSGDKHRRVKAAGRDIYAFSAPLVCEVVERILSPGFDHRGAFAPGEILDAGDVLRALTEGHITLAVDAR